MINPPSLSFRNCAKCELKSSHEAVIKNLSMYAAMAQLVDLG